MHGGSTVACADHSPRALPNKPRFDPAPAPPARRAGCCASACACVRNTLCQHVNCSFQVTGSSAPRRRVRCMNLRTGCGGPGGSCISPPGAKKELWTAHGEIVMLVAIRRLLLTCIL